MRRLDGKPANVKYQDLTGKRFGLLTALRALPKEFGKPRIWECRCDCGADKTIAAGELIDGNSRSCGCRKRNVLGESARLPDGVASFNFLYYKYRVSANKRSLEFSLSKEEFSTLTSSVCNYCGVEPLQSVFNNKAPTPYTYNGVDRVDNKLGYTKENCVPCCYTCNVAKRSMSLAEFLAWIDRLVKFCTNLKVMPSASEQEQHL
jgi:hypothetical protein